MWWSLLFWSSLAHAADPPAVAEIRALSRAIADEGPVTIEVDYNATGTLFPGVGGTGETVQFLVRWQEDAPRLRERPEKIVHAGGASTRIWRSEFLYWPDGSVAFAYLDDPTEGELRFYFHEGKTVRVVAGDVVDDDPVEYADAAAAVAGHAVELMALSAVVMGGQPGPDVLGDVEIAVPE